MHGEPADLADACNARLWIADDYGDNHATMRCQREPLHEGLHQETFKRGEHPVTITWELDERVKCDHGCGHWDHEHSEDHGACPKYAEDHEYSDCAYCHEGETPKTCTDCGKPYYLEVHHEHCAAKAHAPQCTCRRCTDFLGKRDEFTEDT